MIRDQSGATFAELMGSLLIFGLLVLVAFDLFSMISRYDLLAKEAYYSQSLLDSYIENYASLYITNETLPEFLESNQEIDLTEEVLKYGSEVKTYGISVKCRNHLSQESNYLHFEIKCDLQGSVLDTEKTFQIKKYIH